MQRPLEELYLRWLYSQVGSFDKASPTYWTLFECLHDKQFVWVVPNDDNRAEDGRDLRQEFLRAEGILRYDEKWDRLGCSMLELLIALSRRAEFEAESFGDTSDWFWHFLEMIEIDKYHDGKRFPAKKIDDILDGVIWRTYEYDGGGGLCPLQDPAEDQREVEIWYQLSAYILEHGY